MNRRAVITFGRFSPPTTGHQKLVDKLQQVAKQQKGMPLIYLSHSEDPSKNPLAYNDKIAITKKAFGSIIQKSASRNILEVLKEIQSKFDEIVIVVGSDRVAEFSVLVNKYNGKEYNFKSIRIISAGERDPDATDVSGMSASKLRELARKGDLEHFSKGVPTKLSKADIQHLFDKIRDGMNVTEENINEVLNVQQRIAKRQSLRRIKGRVALGRRKARFKIADKPHLEVRTKRKARQALRKRLAGKQGERYSELPLSARMAIDRKLESRKRAIKRIARRLMPRVRKAEYERVKSARAHRNENYTFNVEGREVVLNEHEYLELLGYMFDHDLEEGVQKNLSKKSDKYSIPYDQLEQAYVDIKKQVKEEEQVFDKLNIWIIREAVAAAKIKHIKRNVLTNDGKVEKIVRAALAKNKSVYLDGKRKGKVVGESEPGVFSVKGPGHRPEYKTTFDDREQKVTSDGDRYLVRPRYAYDASGEVEESKEVKPKRLVKDRKTGKMYDPDKEFDKLMSNPKTISMFKRMKKTDGAS